MNDLKLLNLIAKGETENILMQKDLTARLNRLTAMGLVDINAGKILITPKGSQFQKEKKVIDLVDADALYQKDMAEFSPTTLKQNTFYVYLCFALSLTAAILLLLFVLNGI